jgi:hypothetical protein
MKKSDLVECIPRNKLPSSAILQIYGLEQPEPVIFRVVILEKPIAFWDFI